MAAKLLVSLLGPLCGIGAAICVLSSLPGAADAAGAQAVSSDLKDGDWAQLSRYAADDARLEALPPDPGRVVFYGDSITDFWIDKSPDFFDGKPYVDRGIAGQTTWQMLIRFRQDVVALRPRIVVILGGINDIGGRLGPSTNEMIENNIASMTDIAASNGIRPILSSVMPVADPARVDRITDLDAWIQRFARRRGYIYVDYFAALADADKRMPSRYSSDGVHPNPQGYAKMEPLVSDAIARELKRR